MGLGVTLDDQFLAELERYLRTLPSINDRKDRHDSWMTAQEIQDWCGASHTAAEIEDFLLERWRRSELGAIRPAKYPGLTNLFRLWGHIECVGPLDRENLEPTRHDQPLELEPLHLASSASQVFVSFSSQDLPLASRVRKDLGSRGIQAWLFQEQIGQHDLIFESVRAAIARCQAIIGLFTLNSLGSAWVYTELDVALGYGKPILALFDASDSDLMTLLETWTPGDPPDFDTSLINALERRYREHAAPHRASVYRQNVTDFLCQLGRYAGLALYPERPQGWFGNERFKDPLYKSTYCWMQTFRVSRTLKVCVTGR